MKSLIKILSEVVSKDPVLLKTQWITPTGKKSTSADRNIKSKKKMGYQFRGFKVGEPFRKNIKQKKNKLQQQPKKQEKAIPIAESFTIQELLYEN